MRKSTRASAPFFVITLYYLIFVGGYFIIANSFTGIDEYLPVGGLEELIERGGAAFEPVEIVRTSIIKAPHTPRLAIGMLGALILMVPISWVYFITTQLGRVDRSFAQTMMILPVIVAGIAMIVQNSIALAFSLAGIVAAVRFRFTLTEPAYTLYVFAAITIGLGAGISALGIATVVSVAFVYTTLILWMIDYGARLKNPFFAFLTSRDFEDEEL